MMFFLMLIVLLMHSEKQIPEQFSEGVTQVKTVSERKEPMEYRIMRLFPAIYDQIFEGKTYDGTRYIPMHCVPITYYQPDKQDAFNDEAFTYYNYEFKGKKITDVENLFIKEKAEIESNQHIFVDMRFKKRKDGTYTITYQIPIEDPNSKLCMVAINHQIYFHVDAATGMIERVGTARPLLAP